MELLISKIAVLWSVIAVIVGLDAGVAIRRGEREQQDEILMLLFMAVSGRQE
jgi:hypothetical protein